jgi:hypothetical protein
MTPQPPEPGPDPHHIGPEELAAIVRYFRRAERADARRRAIRKGIRAVRGLLGLSSQSVAPPEPAFPKGGRPAVLTLPPVLQRDGTCVANAVAGAIETFLCYEAGATSGISRIDADELRRIKCGSDEFDDGIDNIIERARQALDASHSGCPDPRHTWPATVQRINVNTGDPPTHIICDAIKHYGSVISVIDLYVPPDLSALNGRGLYDPPADAHATHQAHALLLVGWELFDGRTVWLAKNSYGEGNGDHGFVRIPWGQRRLQPEKRILAVTSVRHPT